MRSFSRIGGCILGLSILASGLSAGEPVVLGEYVEARTCDVWTGPCFSNGEINLRGDNAILGWVVRSGTWDAVELKDLSIVAVVDAEGTLTTSTEGEVKTVVYLDERATEAQGKALISMAAALAPKYLKDIVRIEKRKISYKRTGSDISLAVGAARSPLAPVSGSIEVRVKTTALNSHCDKICGNEERAYPSLAKLAHVECAKTIENYYRGPAFGLRWNDPNKRSAMFGQFSL